MTDWTEKDTAKETGAGGKETARAFHQAREDARKSGEIKGDEDGCFIATAVYDNFNAPQVKVLRKFRDEFLLLNTTGRFFVRLYYRVSPLFVNSIRHHRFLKTIFKIPLEILVRVMK